MFVSNKLPSTRGPASGSMRLKFVLSASQTSFLHRRIFWRWLPVASPWLHKREAEHANMVYTTCSSAFYYDSGIWLMYLTGWFSIMYHTETSERFVLYRCFVSNNFAVVEPQFLYKADLFKSLRTPILKVFLNENSQHVFTCKCDTFSDVAMWIC